MPTSLFDRVGSIVDEIGAEKQAAYREKTAGSKDMGNTSHPSEKEDENEHAPTEGFQSTDNEKKIKEQVPNNTVETPDATEGNAPKATEVQLGDAKPTGDDPSNENVSKSKPDGDKRVGDQGGTSHPASGEYGEKYSADTLAQMDLQQLCKVAADLGTELAADLANGFFSAPKAPARDANVAAAQGVKVAAQAAQITDELDVLASNIIQEVVKSAYHQADLVTEHLVRELRILKQAEGEKEDPTSGASEGEDHGTEDASGGDPAAAGGLMAAMGGGDPAAGGGDPAAAGGPPGMDPGAGGPPGMDPAAAGGPPGADAGGGAPPEMGQMDDQQALQQLAMALLEAGIDPRALAAAVPDQGGKIASAVLDYQRAGRFEFSEAKKGSAERRVRDYMKGYVRELYARSQR